MGKLKPVFFRKRFPFFQEFPVTLRMGCFKIVLFRQVGIEIIKFKIVLMIGPFYIGDLPVPFQKRGVPRMFHTENIIFRVYPVV